MRIVVALGGNALLRRGQRPDADVQEHNVDVAVAALAPLADEHELIIAHGNGPQVGVLAIESASDPSLTVPYPLDVLVAETQGLIGYWLVQGLRNQLPDREIVAIVTQTVVDPDDGAFADPTKFVGPSYDEDESARVGAARGWTMGRDGDRRRRVVASPVPVDVVELPTIRRLVAAGVIVVCAGGGGAPVVHRGHRLDGVEAVVDKDRTAALVAERLDAHALLILTDVEGVERGHGTPDAEVIASASTSELRAMRFPDGSMGPKVQAACDFVDRTGRVASIGRLDAAVELLAGRAGTQILSDRPPL